jgi:DNA mismatch endonuclease, patch repair protein
MDVVDRATRSRMMAGIGGRDTSPELAVRRALHAAGFRFRLHARDLPGSPDIVLPRYRAAIFVHGCFWHRHQACRFTTTPATRPMFWQKKFDENVARDQRQLRLIKQRGWRPFVIWECEVRDPRVFQRRMRTLYSAVLGSHEVQSRGRGHR